MKLSQNHWYNFIFLISMLSIFSACSGGGSGSDGNKSSGTPITTLELGETKIFNAIAVGVNGALLTVDSPDETMDGLEINIPPGSYDDETVFTISYAPVTGHSGNEHLDPVTPLISIENGGRYADEIMTMKIPVTIEDGYHYMAFYYDEATGALEGIPEVEHDETSLTIATRHFSKILLNRLGYEVTIGTATIESGFQVKKDNWQFENPGTYLQPGGTCSGMSIASLYYYIEKKKKEAYPLLYGLYENGTPSLDEDDTQAIKLCAQAQADYGNNSFDNKTIEVWRENNKQKGEIWTYFLFIHAMLLTGEPQYIEIWTANAKIGHAMVVYKKSGNDLYVADPNLPEDNTVKIEFDWSSDPKATDHSQLTGSFKPFESQWNKDSKKIDFTEFYYVGKTSVLDWTALKSLWGEIENETVGKDFPDYDLKIIEKDASGIERESILTDGYKTTNSQVEVKVEAYEFDPRINVFYQGIGAKNNHAETVEVNLVSGDNDLGFLIDADMYSDVTKIRGWAWVDFQDITITLEKEGAQTTGSISVTNTLDEDVRVYFSDKDGIPLDYDDVKPGGTFNQVYPPGTYKIYVNAEYISWTREVTLSAGQNYVYNFESSHDCSGVKVAIFNNTPNNGYLSYIFKNDSGTEERWRHRMDANEKKDIYLNFVRGASEFYLHWVPHGGSVSYKTDWFTIDCTKKYSWTVTGSLEVN